MSLRFWRRIRIAPGLRVNLSKSGASVSSAAVALGTPSVPEASA